MHTNSTGLGARNLASILTLSAIISSALHAQTVTATLPVSSSPDAIALNPVTNTIYVGNSGDGTVTIINGAKGEATTVKVAKGTQAIAVNAASNKIYVASSTAGVSVIDGVTGTVTGTIAAGTGPSAVAVNPVTNKIYVAAGDGTVTVVDGISSATKSVAAGTSPNAIAVNPVTNKIYVTNAGANTVTVVDGVTNAMTTVSVGTFPESIVVNPVTNKIYVANGSSNSVSVIDGVTNAVTAVPVGVYPYALALNPVTNKIYVANYYGENVTVIDGGSNSTTSVTVGAYTTSVAVNAATNKIYAANNGSNSVTVIDGATAATTSLTAGSGPSLVAVNPVTNKVYAVNSSAPTGSVTVIDGATYTESTIAAASQPSFAVTNPVTNKVYVLNEGSANVTAIDAATNTPTTVAVGNDPSGADVNPITNKIYVANQTDGTVTVIDGVTNNTTPVTVGPNPVSVAVNPVTNKIYVANYNAAPNGPGSISVIDGTTNTVTVTVPVGINPIWVTVNPVTNKIYSVNYTSTSVSVIDGVTSTVLTTIPLAPGSLPVSAAVNPVTNKIYVANSGLGTVTVIDGITNTSTIVTVGTFPFSLAVNAVTNRIYVGNSTSGTVSVIDGVSNNATAVTVGTDPGCVLVNAVTNKIYVINSGSNNVTVIDGLTNTPTTLAAGTDPLWAALNTVTNTLYVVNSKSSNVTAITEQQLAASPLTTSITPLTNNQTASATPTITFTANSTTATVPDGVYFQVDSWQNAWSLGTGTHPTFSGTLAALSPGFHTLYAYAGDGQEATSAQTGSPVTGAIQAYGFLVTAQTSNLPVTVGANITGASFTVDGVSYKATQSFQWIPGSSHVLTVTSPQAAAATGTQYSFTGWSDGTSGLSDTVVATADVAAYTANFITQYLLTTASNNTGGTVTPGGYFNASAVVPVAATPNTGYIFLNWNGPVTNAASAITTVKMTAPQSITAVFDSTVAVTAVSVTPSAGSGSTQTFTAVYSDPNGGTDLNAVYVLFNSSVSAVNGCYVAYSPTTSSLSLKNDAGTANTLLPLGSTGSVANSQCTLSAAGSSYTTSGNLATLTLALKFNSTTPTNIYLYANGRNGTNSGFVQKGTWQAAPPTVVSVTPNSGSALSQTFSAVFSDVNGAANITAAYLLLNSSVSSVGGCYVLYYPATNLIYLKNDAGTANSAGITPGSPAQVNNSQCTVSAAGSSYVATGNTATLKIALTFSSSAPTNIYLYAADKNGTNSNFVQKGTYGQPAVAVPSVVSITPNSGTALTQTFQAVYSDSVSASGLTALYVLFNSSVSAAHGCYVLFYPSSNLMYLKNDAGTANSVGITPGSAAQVSNSQCTLSGTGSSLVISGKTATFNVALSFTASAPTNIYLYAAETNGSNTGFVVKGLYGAPAVQTVTVSLVNTSLITYSNTTGNVHINVPATTTGSSAGCSGQLVNVSLDNTAVGVISTPKTTPPVNPATSVCVPTGLQDAPFTLTTNSATGNATVTGFANLFQSGTAAFSVAARQVALTLAAGAVGQGKNLAGTVTLSNLAPNPTTDPSFPSGVTFNLTSNLPNIATVTGTVTIPAGQSTGTFTVTGQTPGTASISTASLAGYSTPSVPVTVTSPAQSITIPQNLTVGPTQSLPFPVSIGAPATNPVTITFASSGGPGTAAVSPASVTIPVGATTPTTQPQITGGTLGNVFITASAPNYGADTEAVNISVTLSLTPNSQTVLTSNTVNYTLSASSIAPTAGFVVNLSVADTTKATVPATVTIPAGMSSTTVTVTGVAAGNTTLQASGTGFVTATAAIVVANAPATTLTYNGILGYNEQQSIANSYVALAAPAGNLSMAISSTDASKVILGNTPNGAFGQSITVTIAAGSTVIPTFYVQGLASTGTTTVKTHAVGYADANLLITMVPTGFYISGGTNTTSLSGTSPVSVTFTELNPSTFNNQSGSAYLRSSAPPVTVNLTNSNAAVGTLGANSVTINAGQYGSSTTFQPLSAGTATISIAATPMGYTAESDSQSTAFTVTQPNLGFYGGYLNSYCLYSSAATTFSCNLGQDEQYPVFEPYLYAAAPAGGKTVTLTSSDPKKVLLTTNPNAVGTASITVSIAAGSTYGPAVYVQGLVSSGTVTITETATGYNTATGSFTMIPTGFNVGGGTSTTTFATSSAVAVYFTELDPTQKGQPSQGALRIGANPVVVGLTNSNSAVGTLGANSVTISPGQSYNSTTFQPVSAGAATISITATPTGYTAEADSQSTAFSVTAPNLGFYGAYLNPYCLYGGLVTTFSCNIGKDEQYGIFEPFLYTAAPAGGRTITLTSSDPGKLLLTTNPNAVGTVSITVNIAAGRTYGPPVYVQGLLSSGSVTIAESASGYNTATATLNLVPTGFNVSGGGSTTTFSTASAVSVYFSELNPTTQKSQNGPAYLRAGANPVTVGLTDSSSAVGTLGANSVTVSPGQSYNSTTFQPVSAGTATITIAATPVGYTPEVDSQTTAFTVTAPNLGFYGAYLNPYCLSSGIATTFSCNLGKDEQLGVFEPYLNTPAPAGGRSITLTSSDPAKVLLTTNANVVGTASVTVSIAAGSSYGPAIYVQGLVSTGTVTITETASGYNTATGTLVLVPTGFSVSGGTNTTTFSSPSTVYVTFSELDPTTLNSHGQAYPRAGVSPVVVNLTNSNPPVGTLASSSVTVSPGLPYGTTTFQPASAGTTTISIAATPTGYTKESDSQSTLFTVTAPNLGFYGAYLNSYCLYSPVNTTFSCNIGKDEQIAAFEPFLDAPAPSGGRTVTLTSSDPTKVLLTTNANAVGTASVTVSIAAGSSYGPAIYIQGLASSGTVTITETASGYNNATGTFSLVPTGFNVSGGTNTTTFSGPSTVYATFSELDPTTLNSQHGQAYLRAGASPVVVSLTNSNPTVGTLMASSVTVSPGQIYGTTTFQPVSQGIATIGIAATPTGYTPESDAQSTVFTVAAPAITFNPSGPVTVGQNLETSANVQLAIGAPTATTMTLTSTSPSLVLSTDPTVAGTATLTFPLAAGASTSPTFYVQSLSGARTVANISISVPGFAPATGAVTINPSGFVFQTTTDFSTNIADNPVTLTVIPSVLDPVYLTPTQTQLIRPGLVGTAATITLTDQSGTSPVGSITTNPVIFSGADNPNMQTTSFKALNVGSTLLQITSPTGFTNASSQITATVTQ